jgi:hypothetical protein
MWTFCPSVQDQDAKYAVCIDSYKTLQNARGVTSQRGMHEWRGMNWRRRGQLSRRLNRALVEEHIPST